MANKESQTVSEEITTHPYDALTPEVVLDAVDSFGVVANGSLLALNSYENRVYQVGLDEGEPLIAKFYRPGRWSSEAIHEEHAFSHALQEHEIPVVAPLKGENGESLFEHAGFRFALFPRRGGHAPELSDFDHLEWLGRFMARIHAVGASGEFEHRPTLGVAFYGRPALDYLLENDFLPSYLASEYQSLAEQMLQRVDAAFAELPNLQMLRIHGDGHVGNVLWREGPHFVDLDDCMTGPAIQDLWMLLSGERHEMVMQLDALLMGYEEFFEFDLRELTLIEPLRALRMIYYAGWLARRWSDPAFPMAFPWFNSERYWEEQLVALREQLLRLDAPPLTLGP